MAHSVLLRVFKCVNGMTHSILLRVVFTSFDIDVNLLPIVYSPNVKHYCNAFPILTNSVAPYTLYILRKICTFQRTLTY